jgi:ABC-type glycerol-3-phosphate transport system substrate-binding protein
MNNFQTILTAVFLAFFVFAVLIFSGLLKIGEKTATSNGPVGKVVIWGTFNSPDILKVFDDTTQANKDLTISYIKKPKDGYQQTLIEAFANGTGPDLFFITPDMIQKNQNFIYKIPFTSYPQKTFQDSFIDGADVYLTPDGALGFPVVVDPIVMYYNKDILSNEGIASPPSSWDQLFALAPTLTKKKDDGTVLQSMIALGQYQNITNAKDILATLLLQVGNPIVSRGTTGYEAVLNGGSSATANTLTEQVLNFFTEFSNPQDQAYSWNRALPNSLDMFTSGKLAFYIGHASELFTIQSVNPNLSFDVTTIPQTKNTTTKRTYGDIYSVVVNKKSSNLGAAFSLAGILSSGETAKSLGVALSLPPANRALLSVKPTDPYLFTFFNGAITTRTWADPDTNASDSVFNELIENILSSKLSTPDAINKAQNELELLVKK